MRGFDSRGRLTRFLSPRYLGSQSTTSGAWPLVAACLLCLSSKPVSSRGLGEAPRLAPKPLVGAVVEAWWSGASCASSGPTAAPWSLVPGSSHAELRALSPWGWDSRAPAQSSRRRPARVRARAITRYSVGGCSAREPVVRAAALHQLAGHPAYRYSNVPYLTVFPRTVFRTTIHPKISESRPLRGREGLGTYTRTSKYPVPNIVP